MISWIVAAIGAGAWLGIAGRIAMRLVSLEAGTAVEFSVGGTLEVVAFGILLGSPVALLVWIVRRRGRWPSWSGSAAAALLFAAVATRPPPAARSALRATADTPAVTAVLFALAFLSYGVIVDVVWARSQRAHRSR